MSGPLDSVRTSANDPDAPPPALLPYQQRWVADKSPLKVGEKSRRIGLTWAEAADDVLDASRAGGTNVFYIGPTQDMALEYIEACAMWARAFSVAAGEMGEGLFEDIDEHGNSKHIKTYVINFPGSGRRIVALSSRPTNLRGKQGKIIIDEAAFHPDLKALLKAALAMLLWGDRVVLLSTHFGVDNPFNELINEIRAGKRKGSVQRIAFREAVAEGLYQRVCLRRHADWSVEGEAQWVADAYDFYGDDAAEELDVVPSLSGGAYLTMALIEARMSPDTPIVRGRWSAEFNLQPEPVRRREVERWCEEELLPHLKKLNPVLAHSVGLDFARVADLTVMPVLEESPTLIQRARLHVELANCPFRQQEQIVDYVCDRLPRFRSGAFDATGNGAALAEHAADRYGTYRIEQVKFSDTFYIENMPKFKAAFEDGTITDLPRDSEVRDDLRSLRLINGVPKVPPTPTQKAGERKLQRHGDAAIGYFLAHYAAKRDVAPIAFEAAPNKRDRWDADPDRERNALIPAYDGAW